MHKNSGRWFLFICLLIQIEFPVFAAAMRAETNQQGATLVNTGYFIENAGQLLDDKGRPATQVLFYGNFAGYNMYFTRDALVYEFYEQDLIKASGGKSAFDIPVNLPENKAAQKSRKKFRLDMAFLHSNPHVQLLAKGKRQSYNNYYCGGASLSAFNEVALFDSVIYHNIYPKIDLIFYLLPEGKGIKYDFIVHPGGDPAQIAFNYKGAERVSLDKNGGLLIETPLGTLQEEKPFTYQNNGKDQSAIPSKFSVKRKSIGFTTGKYNKSLDLVVDPSILVWATYYGGNGTSEQTIHMSSDASGNLILSGNTNGTTFPTSAGAIQTVYGGGGLDGFILKFTPDGTRLWGTYFGGSRDDNARSCEADASGNIFVTGFTTSLNFPLLNPGGGAYYLTVNQASTTVITNPTVFIAKLTPTGGLTWSTYFGGNVGESGTDVWLDASNNLLVTGCTASSDFPVTAGAFQTTMAGPNISGSFGDAFLAKFNNSGVQQWTTLIGGSQDEIGYGLCTDPTGEIFLTGYTVSSNFPTSAAAYQSSYGGGSSDVFFARFSPAGTRSWSTYYGSNGGQRALDIRYKDNFLYATGYGAGTLPGPAGSAFQPNNAGGSGDGIIIKLSPNSSAAQVIWRSFCGGSGDDGFDELTTNNAGNIVCGGWTNSANYPATPNAYQSVLGGGYDGQIATVDPDGKLICATYFGGSNTTDNVYGLAIASNDDVFCSGNTGSSTAQGFVITAGAFQSTKGAGLDAYIARISEIPPPPVSAFDTNPATGCIPHTVTLDNNSTSINTCLSNTTWEWSFPGGTPASSALENPPSVTYNAAGTYTITLKVTNASGNHSSSKDITVSAGIPISLTPDPTICNGTSTTLTASGADTYTWSPATGLSATSGASVTANPGTTTTYTVTGTNSAGCSGTATVKVTVTPALTATISPDVGICSGDSTTLTAGGGADYAWSPATGLSSTTGASVTASPTTTTTYTVTVSSGSCTPVTASVTVTILANTVATVSPDVSICSGGSGTVLTAGGGDTYTWSPSAGLSSNAGASVTANPPSTTTYTVSVSSGSCPAATASVTVTVVPAPMATLSPDVSICSGESTILTAGGGDSYTWSPPTGLSSTSGASVSASPTNTTTYTVSAQRTGCSASTATVTVTVNPSTPPNAGADVSICQGSSVILQGSGASNYNWSPATGLSCTDCPNPVASPNVSTTYTLTDPGGLCSSSGDMVMVTVQSLPLASAGPPMSVPRGASTTLNASGGVAYRWLPNLGTGEKLLVSPTNNTLYCVEATDANGCTDTACTTVSVTEPVISTLWVPNSFTPNEDQLNGQFKTPGTNIIEYRAFIFNRWGELIYEWRDIEKGWDGTYQGAPVQDDIYAYRIRALGADGVRHDKRGMILIIK